MIVMTGLDPDLRPGGPPEGGPLVRALGKGSSGSDPLLALGADLTGALGKGSSGSTLILGGSDPLLSAGPLSSRLAHTLAEIRLPMLWGFRHSGG